MPERPGFDQIAQGMGGLMSVTGLPGQGPVRVGIPIADLCAGLFCALGIMVALLEREKSKQGPAHLDLAAAGADFHARFPGRALAGERRSRRSRPATIIRPPSRPASSRPPTATSTSPRPARRSGSACCKALGAPKMMDEARITPTRAAARRTATRSTPKSTATPTSAPAPNGSSRSTRPACRAGPIYSIDQMFADPQVEASRHRAGREEQGQVGDEARRPADDAVAHAEPAGRASAGASASTPTRCSRNSASRPRRSRRCARRMRYDDVDARASDRPLAANGRQKRRAFGDEIGNEAA